MRRLLMASDRWPKPVQWAGAVIVWAGFITACLLFIALTTFEVVTP
jgi:hypothetical protein